MDHYDEQTVIPKNGLTFPRNSFEYRGVLGRVFLYFGKMGCKAVTMLRLRLKTDREVVAVVHSIISMLGEKEDGPCQRNMRKHLPTGISS